MRVKLIGREHYETGTIGFVPTFHENWFKSCNSYLPPVTRFGHDLIEHTKTENGSVEHEFRALGAHMWVSNFYSEGNTSVAGFTNDLISTLWDGFRSGGSVEGFSSDMLKAPKRGNVGKDELSEIRSTCNIAFDDIANTVALTVVGRFYPSEQGHKEEFDKVCLWVDNNLERIFDWVVYGYWYAQKVRFKRYESWQVFEVYRQLQELDFKYIEEGEVLYINYSIPNGTVTARRTYNYRY